MSTDEKELLFVDKENFSQSWIVELNQKLTFCIHKIADKIDIREDEYELLRALYRLHWTGDYILNKRTVDMTEETAVQNGLFDTLSTTVTDIKNVYDDLAQ